MRILHTSDLHLTPLRVGSLLESQGFDLWLDTGDHFPSFGRAIGDRVSPEAEVSYQRQFVVMKSWGVRLAEWLDGRPLVSIAGNHDFISLVEVLRAVGYTNAHEVTPDGITVAGKTFAGFREVPFIAGEWMGETHLNDFRPLVDRVVASGAEILATHAPANGILDRETSGRFNYGIPSLVLGLCYGSHAFTHHFFGHAHVDGGNQVEEMGITFANGAGRMLVHEI